MLFRTPPLEPRESEVIAEIEAIAKEFQAPLPKLRHWPGLPWRGIEARLAGRVDTSDEAQAAAEHYRAALGFVLQLADIPDFRYDEGVFRALHYLIVGAEPAKNPGRWRRGAMVVARPVRFADLVDYRAPDFREVPALLGELIAWLNSPDEAPVLVRAAMAHLNLAAIHPFLDANGRMARALHTLVLARAGMWLPAFSSIDEYLASNSGAYAKALQQTNDGAWQPERDARPWVRYCLTAHLRQARRFAARSRDYDRLWDELEREAARRALPERTVSALVDAAMGGPLASDEYRMLAEVSATEAGEDLETLVEAGLLVPAQGDFVASEALQAIATRCCAPEEPEPDPFAAGASARAP